MYSSVQWSWFPGETGKMKTVSFAEFGRNASEILDPIEQGETVRVLRHGKATVKIVPADGPLAKTAWKHPGPRLVAAGASLSRTVREERRSSP